MQENATQAGDGLTVAHLSAHATLRAISGGQTKCDIVEVATLSDRREITLSDDRGWATSARLEDLTIGSVVSSILTAVLPDNAESTGDQHEWSRFVDALRRLGIDTPADALRQIPYTVNISTSLLPSCNLIAHTS